MNKLDYIVKGVRINIQLMMKMEEEREPYIATLRFEDGLVVIVENVAGDYVVNYRTTDKRGYEVSLGSQWFDADTDVNTISSAIFGTVMVAHNMREGR